MSESIRDIDPYYINYIINSGPSFDTPSPDGKVTPDFMIGAWVYVHYDYRWGKYYHQYFIGRGSDFDSYQNAVIKTYTNGRSSTYTLRTGTDDNGGTWLVIPQGGLKVVDLVEGHDSPLTDPTGTPSISTTDIYNGLPPHNTESIDIIKHLVLIAPYYHLYRLTEFKPLPGRTATAQYIIDGNLYGTYIGTYITQKPDVKMEISSVNRSGSTYNVHWSLDPYATSQYNYARVTSLSVRVSIDMRKDNAGSRINDSKSISEDWPLSSTSYSFSLEDVLDGMTREDFFPYVDTRIMGVWFHLYGKNHFGSTEMGHTHIDVASPDLPTIGNFEYDSSTGIASARITAPASVGEKKKKSSSAVDLTECVAMDYYIENIYSRTKSQSQSAPATTTYENSVTVSSDAVQKGSLTFGDYIQIVVGARSLGIAGKSDYIKKSIYVSYPSRPIVTSAIVPSPSMSDNVIVNIALGTDETHPTTNVKLQKLMNVTYESSSEIPVDANWQDTDSEDNRECVALSIPVADVYPQRGRKVWLRVKAWNMDEELCRYSTPVRLTKLERPERTAADDYITIASISSHNDGTSAWVKLAWDRNGRDDSNRTEISWSTNMVAWKSTEGPSTFDMPDDVWKEGGTHVSFDNTGSYWYNASATVYLEGLEEGKQYFVKARRVRDPQDDDANGVTYGPYSSMYTVTPYSVPESVTADIPEVVAYGEPMHVDWGYTGTSTQTSWLVTIETLSQDGSMYFISRVLAAGYDATTSCDIPWSAFSSYLNATGTYYMRVWVSTGGSYWKSDHKRVRFANRPVLTRPNTDSSTDYAMTQPINISMICSEPSDLTVTVTARNATRLFPDGARQQVAGDTIWSGVVSPYWELCTSTKRAEWEDTWGDESANFDSASQAYGDYMQEVADANQAIEDAQQAVNDAYDAIPAVPNQDDYESEEEYDAAMEQYQSDYQTAMDNLQAAKDAVQDAYNARDAIDHNGTPEAYERAIGKLYDAKAYTAFLDMGDNKRYVAVFSLNGIFDLVNMSTYDVSITATSTESGLTSKEVNFCVVTNYCHLAPNPVDYVTVEPYESTDNGKKTIGARIDLPYFPGMLPHDVYDVYRVVNGKPVLIADGISQNSSVDDQYAPYGGMTTAYRVATRTRARSLSWYDFPYEHSRRTVTEDRMLRIDWDGKYVELTHCITNSDSYQKDFEATKHLDGSVAGHWNAGAMRTASFSATVIDVYEAETLDLLRDLAAYDGPCFVRTSDGIAYEADVEVGDISESYGKASINVSFSASEVELTSEYKPERQYTLVTHGYND